VREAFIDASFAPAKKRGLKDNLDAQLRHYGIEVIARTAATEESKHKTNVV
jgi:hypothetical protein